MLSEALPAHGDDARDMHSLIRRRMEGLPATVRHKPTPRRRSAWARRRVRPSWQNASTLTKRNWPPSSCLPSLPVSSAWMQRRGSSPMTLWQSEAYGLVCGGSVVVDHARIAKSMIDLGYATTRERLCPWPTRFAKVPTAILPCASVPLSGLFLRMRRDLQGMSAPTIVPLRIWTQQPTYIATMRHRMNKSGSYAPSDANACWKTSAPSWRKVIWIALIAAADDRASASLWSEDESGPDDTARPV